MKLNWKDNIVRSNLHNSQLSCAAPKTGKITDGFAELGLMFLCE